jgi:Outer membrane protein beta-barrel domain
MKKIIAITLFMLPLITASAQESYFYFNLDINTPLSNRDWISSTSGNGARVGYRKFITDKFSAGIDIGWASYNQYFPTESFVNGTTTTTTDYFNYVTNYTFAASGQYNFKIKPEWLIPYAGIGLGAANNQYTRYYNIYTDEDQSWGFLARPEAGVLIRFSQRRAIGGMVAVHYDFSTAKSETFNYTSFSNLGVQVGLMLMAW